MRSLKIAGLCLASMLMMGMAVAGTASATADLWLVCLEGVGLTKYSNSECNKAEAGGKWQSLGLLPGQTDTVRIVSFTLTLRDKNTIAGVSEIRCDGHGSAQGQIQEGGKGQVAAGEVENASTNCHVLKGGCKEGEIKKVASVNNPWEITSEEKTGGKLKYLFLINPGNKEGKEPGWEVKCNTLLGEQTDTCTSPKGEPEHAWGENVFTKEGTKETLLVLGEFARTVLATCSQGGAKEGEVEGNFAILLAKGGPLSLNR